MSRKEKINVLMSKHQVTIQYEIPAMPQSGLKTYSAKAKDNLDFDTWILTLEKIIYKDKNNYNIKFTIKPETNYSDILDSDFNLSVHKKPLTSSSSNSNVYANYTSEEPHNLVLKGSFGYCDWPDTCSITLEFQLDFNRKYSCLKFGEDFEKLFETKKFADITFKCKGIETFRAHKAILAARSPVFETMFDNDMEEVRKSTINIEDISPEVLSDMLLYIYCGKISNLKNCHDLFVAADKYQIEDLMDFCYQHLLYNVTDANLIDCFKLSEMYNKKELKEAAIKFFTENESEMKNLMENKDWMDMVSSYPLLANEIMKAFFSKLNKNNAYS